MDSSPSTGPVVSSGTPGYFVWAPAGKKIAIHLLPELVDRMNFEVMRGFGAVPKRGAEIGGILIGTVDSGPEPVIRIEDFQCVPCEHLRGPSYILAEDDVVSLDATLVKWPSESDPRRVVGFFRSNTRELLQLGEEDLALLDARFPDDASVCLLIRPYTTRPNEATFLLRENGKFPAEAQYDAFVFRRREMGGGTPMARIERPGPGDPPAAPLAPAARPGVGSAPPADLGLVLQRPSAIPSPPKESAPAGGPDKEPPGLRPQRRPDVEPAPASASAPVEERLPAEAPRPSRLSRLTPAQPATPSVTPVRSALADVRSAPVKRSRWVWVPLSFIFLLLGIVLGVEITLSMNRAQTLAQGGDPYSMELSVSRFGESYHLKWNPNLNSVRAAKRGELSIREGTATDTKQLTADDLARGGIIYRGSAESIQFRLTLFVRDRATLSETVETTPAKP